jgi:hypothetical protein
MMVNFVFVCHPVGICFCSCSFLTRCCLFPSTTLDRFLPCEEKVLAVARKDDEVIKAGRLLEHQDVFDRVGDFFDDI